MHAGRESSRAGAAVSTWTDDDAASAIRRRQGRSDATAGASQASVRRRRNALRNARNGRVQLPPSSSRVARVLTTLLVAVVVGACGSSEAPSGSDSADGETGDFLLRAALTQALLPESLFGSGPVITITADRTVVTNGPVLAIFPGPLAPNLRGRSITAAGVERIVNGARTLGLLEGDGVFSPADVAPGAQQGRVELIVDGALRTITGDPGRVMQCIRAPCEPAPSSPEAFATFWQALLDLPSMMPEELGREFAYEPEAWALLIGIQPPDDDGIASQVVEWPLERALADTGRPTGDGPLPRCGTVRGADAAVLTDAFAGANQLTTWIDRGGAEGDAVSIAVRPLLTGEDACRELFGIEE